MKQRSNMWLSSALLMCSLAGCAIVSETQDMGAGSAPSAPSDDSHASGHGEDVRMIFIDLLGIDLGACVDEINAAVAEEQEAYQTFLKEHGATNFTWTTSSESYGEFLRDFHPVHTNTEAAFVVAWGCWDDIAGAERLFCRRMTAAGVPPRCAFRALRLSAQQRSQLGQREATLGDTHGFEVEGAATECHEAMWVLNALLLDPTPTPMSTRLSVLAYDGLAQAATAADERRWWSYRQRILDALETAKSAEALRALEINCKPPLDSTHEKPKRNAVEQRRPW